MVLIDATGKGARRGFITGIDAGEQHGHLVGERSAHRHVHTRGARIETQELRYTWMLTVIPSSGGGSSNVEVTVFFHRPLVASDEQVFQATGVDGVQTPFIVTYAGTKPFIKKGGFLFDAYFGRWYRIVNVANDTGSQVERVRRPAPAAGRRAGDPNFGAVFMRGVVDVFPLPLK